jgi:uncharacterized protein (DUF1501 family)
MHDPGCDRRLFLLRTGALGLGLLLRGPTARTREAGRTLILVELEGGNDALNTLVPIEDDVYHRLRPTLRFEPQAVHPVGEGLSLAPALRRLARRVREGELTLLPAVGWPLADRSHFRSRDRWQTGLMDPAGRDPGWLGAVLDAPGRSAAGVAFAFGEAALPRLLHRTRGLSVATPGIEGLLPAPEVRGFLLGPALAELDARTAGREEAQALATAQRLLRRLCELAERPVGVSLPRTELGRHVADALRVLECGLEVPAILIRVPGFDTHARQASAHAALLADLDHALDGLLGGLAALRPGSDPLLIVLSEFGRRVAENGSRGTDHGAAGCVLIAGGRAPGGILGPGPDLRELADGDLRPLIDMRAVLGEAMAHLGDPAPELRLGPAGRPLFG